MNFFIQIYFSFYHISKPISAKINQTINKRNSKMTDETYKFTAHIWLQQLCLQQWGIGKTDQMYDAIQNRKQRRYVRNAIGTHQLLWNETNKQKVYLLVIGIQVLFSFRYCYVVLKTLCIYLRMHSDFSIALTCI